MRISLTRTVRFRASHRYWKPDWTPEENRARFGPATEPHEHQYACRVTVGGPLDPATAMIMDLARLDRLLEEEVHGRLEGKALDREVPAFAPGQALPSCEAIARDIFTRMATRLPPGVVLESVEVAEDDGLSATCSER